MPSEYAARYNTPAVIKAILTALPKSLPSFVRDDVSAEIMLALLERRLKVADISKRVREFIATYNREHNTFRDLSLDATIPGTTMTYLDCLASNRSPAQYIATAADPSRARTIAGRRKETPMPTAKLQLPPRRGPRPRTSVHNPHQQLEQNAPVALQDELVDRVLAFEGVALGESVISGEGARAFILDPLLAKGPPAAFFLDSTEFAHIHVAYDGSLHAKIPPDEVSSVIEAGWGEPHPMAARMGGPLTNLMLYGPRDGDELDVILGLVARAYEYARDRTG